LKRVARAIVLAENQVRQADELEGAQPLLARRRRVVGDGRDRADRFSIFLIDVQRTALIEALADALAFVGAGDAGDQRERAQRRSDRPT
jgi:hypothetical protein